MLIKRHVHSDLLPLVFQQLPLKDQYSLLEELQLEQLSYILSCAVHCLDIKNVANKFWNCWQLPLFCTTAQTGTTVHQKANICSSTWFCCSDVGKILPYGYQQECIWPF